MENKAIPIIIPKKKVANAMRSPLMYVIIPHKLKYNIEIISSNLLFFFKLINKKQSPRKLNLAISDPGTKSLKGPDNLP